MGPASGCVARSLARIRWLETPGARHAVAPVTRSDVNALATRAVAPQQATPVSREIAWLPADDRSAAGVSVQNMTAGEYRPGGLPTCGYADVRRLNLDHRCNMH